MDFSLVVRGLEEFVEGLTDAVDPTSTLGIVLQFPWFSNATVIQNKTNPEQNHQKRQNQEVQTDLFCMSGTMYTLRTALWFLQMPVTQL